jgi:hypothetical protein
MREFGERTHLGLEIAQRFLHIAVRPAMDEDDERAVCGTCRQIEGGMSLGLDGVFGDGPIDRHIRSRYYWRTRKCTPSAPACQLS